jgi:hypothetical protein
MTKQVFVVQWAEGYLSQPRHGHIRGVYETLDKAKDDTIELLTGSLQWTRAHMLVYGHYASGECKFVITPYEVRK